jgi:hypothetical protein
MTTQQLEEQELFYLSEIKEIQKEAQNQFLCFVGFSSLVGGLATSVTALVTRDEPTQPITIGVFSFLSTIVCSVILFSIFKFKGGDRYG